MAIQINSFRLPILITTTSRTGPVTPTKSKAYLNPYPSIYDSSPRRKSLASSTLDLPSLATRRETRYGFSIRSLKKKKSMGSIPIEPVSPDSSFDGVFDVGLHYRDYVGEYLASIRRGADIVRDIQAYFPDTTFACNDLIRVLNELAMHVRQNYENDTWLEEAPPASIMQTLRRLKNWAGPRESVSELESPSKRDVSISRLRSFTSKFQSILSALEESYALPVLKDCL